MTATITTGAAGHHRAILVMCAGVACLVMSDAAAKLLLAAYDPLQILFVRSLVAAPVMLALVLRFDGARALRSPHLGLHALRGLLYIGAVAAFYASLQSLSLAVATSLIFTAPLFITAFSAVILKDRIHRHHWAAVLAGFAGALIVIRPGGDTFQAAALFALAAAAIYALMMISARWISTGDSYRTMTFYLTLFPGLYCSFVLFTPWPALAPGDPWLFAATALCGTLGVSLISQAFRMGPAPVVAPFDYTALAWASLLGWLIWGTVPDIWVYAGAAVIIASGIYLILKDDGAVA